MRKIIVLMSTILFFGAPLCFAQEEIAITTYYPSPHGVYDSLLTDKLGVGDNDGDGGLDSGDVPVNPGDVWIAGNVGIGTTNPSTPLAIVGLNSGGGNVLRIVPGTGSIYYEASSARYKDDIRDFKDNFYKVLQARPKSFVYKTTGQRDIGYTAEDFDKLGLDDLLIYRDGQPDAIKYDRLPLYILEIIKDQQRQIDKLSMQNKELEATLKTLQASLSQ